MDILFPQCLFRQTGAKAAGQKVNAFPDHYFRSAGASSNDDCFCVTKPLLLQLLGSVDQMLVDTLLGADLH